MDKFKLDDILKPYNFSPDDPSEDLYLRIGNYKPDPRKKKYRMESEKSRGKIGEIYSLNYDPEIEKGFISKIIVKLLGRKDELGKDAPYELIRPHRFSGDYIQAIDDVFDYIKINHPKLVKYELGIKKDLKTGYEKIKFKDYCFGIDVLDPPATPISIYSGDSVGAAIFVCVVSAFFYIRINKRTAVTGSLRSKLSKEVGMVGNIPGKIKGFIDLALEEKDFRVKFFCLPNIEYLLEEELINREELIDILEELKAFKLKGPGKLKKDLSNYRKWEAFPRLYKLKTLGDYFIECFGDNSSKGDLNMLMIQFGWQDRYDLDDIFNFFKKSEWWQDHKY